LRLILIDQFQTPIGCYVDLITRKLTSFGKRQG
jgi:hypothetical protein